MSKQEESALSHRIKLALNARGHKVWKNHGSHFSERGLPDLTGVSKDGRAIALEIKMPGKERSGLSVDQKKFLRDLVKTSPLAIVAVVSSVQKAIHFCENNLRSKVDADGFVEMVTPDGLTVEESYRWRKAALALGNQLWTE